MVDCEKLRKQLLKLQKQLEDASGGVLRDLYAWLERYQQLRASGSDDCDITDDQVRAVVLWLTVIEQVADDDLSKYPNVDHNAPQRLTGRILQLLNGVSPPLSAIAELFGAATRQDHAFAAQAFRWKQGVTMKPPVSDAVLPFAVTDPHGNARILRLTLRLRLGSGQVFHDPTRALTNYAAKDFLQAVNHALALTTWLHSGHVVSRYDLVWSVSQGDLPFTSRYKGASAGACFVALMDYQLSRATATSVWERWWLTCAGSSRTLFLGEVKLSECRLSGTSDVRAKAAKAEKKGDIRRFVVYSETDASDVKSVVPPRRVRLVDGRVRPRQFERFSYRRIRQAGVLLALALVGGAVWSLRPESEPVSLRFASHLGSARAGTSLALVPQVLPVPGASGFEWVLLGSPCTPPPKLVPQGATARVDIPDSCRSVGHLTVELKYQAESASQVVSVSVPINSPGPRTPPDQGAP